MARIDEANNYFTTFPLLETNGTIYNRDEPAELFSINYNGVLTSNFFVEGHYSAKNFTFKNSGSSFNELIKGTPVMVLDRGNGQMFGSIFCAVCPGASELRNNKDWSVKGTGFFSTKDLGSHNVVFGYSNFSGVHTSNNWQSGSAWLLYAIVRTVRREGPLPDDRLEQLPALRADPPGQPGERPPHELALRERHLETEQPSLVQRRRPVGQERRKGRRGSRDGERQQIQPPPRREL